VFIERPHAFAPEKLDFEVNCTLRVARVMRPPLACAATVVLLDVDVHVPPNSPVDVLKVTPLGKVPLTLNVPAVMHVVEKVFGVFHLIATLVRPPLIE
jgi:hypothetical protein